MQKKKVEFTLPWPISLNHTHGLAVGKKLCRCKITGKVYYKTVPIKYLKTKAKKYQETCCYEIRMQCGGIPKFYNKVKMLAEFTPPDKRIWDVKNHCKLMEDAIVKAEVIPDDSARYLLPTTPVIHKPQKPGCVKITLEEI